MDEKIWRDISVGKVYRPVLCDDLCRQRCVIEFITELDMNNFAFMEKHLISFLKELSNALGMKIFMGPWAGNDFNEETGECGPSAVVGWTTSGAQIHSWPFRHFVSVDLYSCKPYEVGRVIEVIENYFRPTLGTVE